jgi:hypothetical protein
VIKEIIAQWDSNKGKLEERFRSAHPESYTAIVKSIFELVISDYSIPNITVIDNGDYQGTQIFLIPADTYQPSVDDYLVTHTDYGSCSGCDTLEGIRSYDDEKPTETQVKDYMMLALHLVQRLKKLSAAEDE